MTWFPFFVNVINNKCKGIKISIKYCNNCANFSKSKKDMVFHGFIDCVREYFIVQLSFIKKNNLFTLMKHKLSQPNIFNGTLWVVVFCNE